MADEVRVASQVMTERVGGREVFIIIKTEYPAGSSTPERTYVVGPQGQITDTYDEMLELLGVDPRKRPTFPGPNVGETDDHPPEKEMSHEEVQKEIAKDQRAGNAMDEFLAFVSGGYRRRVKPGLVLEPGEESARSGMSNLDRAELERGFADRFPPLPPTEKQYPELDLSAALPEEWVELERMRRSRIFENEYGDHPLARDRRTEDELTEAEEDMQMVRAAEAVKFMHPER